MYGGNKITGRAAAGKPGGNLYSGRRGVTPEGIESLYRQTGICAYHMSAKEKLESAMTYRNRNVHMGLAKLSEYEIYRTSGETVRRAREVLKRL